MAATKTNVYVDGFNLYYGALKGTAFKWLDIRRLCELLLPNHEINRIRYFTALVTARPGDPQQPQRQQVYIRALETSPNLTVHYGTFLAKTRRLPLVRPVAGGPRIVEVLDSEEKGSDVNLATYLLWDGFKGDYETAVVVSNDSDLVVPIQLVRTELQLPVGMLNPHARPSRQMQTATSFYKPIRQGVLASSQFPPTISDSDGQFTKPSSWA